MSATARELSIRPLLARDLPGVLAIERQRPGRSWTRLEFRSAADPGGRVAEAGGRVVGYLIFRDTAGHTALLDIAVAPGWRRRGVARALLGQLHAEKSGPVRAVVPESNLPAQLLLGARWRVLWPQ